MHLLIHDINLHRDFFNEIKSSYTCFDYKKPKYQPDITKKIVYYKIVKTELYVNNEAYNNKKCIM